MNHSISGEILAKESRFPRIEIFFATLIDRTPKSQLLSANYDKSKFLIIGNEKFRKSTLETFEKDTCKWEEFKFNTVNKNNI